AFARGVERSEAALRGVEPRDELVLERNDLGPQEEHLVLDEAPRLAAVALVLLVRHRRAALGARLELGLGVVRKHHPLNAREAHRGTVARRCSWLSMWAIPRPSSVSTRVRSCAITGESP